MVFFSLVNLARKQLFYLKSLLITKIVKNSILKLILDELKKTLPDTENGHQISWKDHLFFFAKSITMWSTTR